jgi:hypothetical protein
MGVKQSRNKQTSMTQIKDTKRIESQLRWQLAQSEDREAAMRMSLIQLIQQGAGGTDSANCLQRLAAKVSEVITASKIDPSDRRQLYELLEESAVVLQTQSTEALARANRALGGVA